AGRPDCRRGASALLCGARSCRAARSRTTARSGPKPRNVALFGRSCSMTHHPAHVDVLPLLAVGLSQSTETVSLDAQIPALVERTGGEGDSGVAPGPGGQA